ncbi:MAG: hypothetical protein CYG60_20755, partial [Actinobacteria bacterium]
MIGFRSAMATDIAFGLGSSCCEGEGRGRRHLPSSPPKMCPDGVFAVGLVGTHAPLLALVAHRALCRGGTTLSPGRPSKAALGVVFGATIAGSALTLRALLDLDRGIHSLEEVSSRDALTGAYNRRAGEERLAEDLARVIRDGGTLTLAVLDLDGLKATNDSLGHAGGDACIKRGADTLQRNLREGVWVARWGGDEFVLGLWDTGALRAAMKVLQRAAWELGEQATLPHLPDSGAELPHATFSAGVVLCAGLATMRVSAWAAPMPSSTAPSKGGAERSSLKAPTRRSVLASVRRPTSAAGSTGTEKKRARAIVAPRRVYRRSKEGLSSLQGGSI